METAEKSDVKKFAIQESDLQLSWRSGKGVLLTAKLRPSRAIEMRYNNQLPRDYLTQIQTLVIIKNGKAISLDVYSEKSTLVLTSKNILLPKFFMKTQIEKKAYEELLTRTHEKNDNG